MEYDFLYGKFTEIVNEFAPLTCIKYFFRKMKGLYFING